jgi:hypothetical protein
LGVFGEEGERVGRRQCSRVTRHSVKSRKAGRSRRAVLSICCCYSMLHRVKCEI